MQMELDDHFIQLVEKYSDEIFVCLWRFLQDTRDAEDCMQETYLRAMRAYPRLVKGSNHRAWLYKIALNTARSSLKRRNHREKKSIELSSLMSDPSPGTATQVEQSELLAEVSAAVHALPERQRSALLLRKYQCLEYAEIAIILNCSESTARANVYQAVKKLQHKFNQRQNGKE